ncbi:MAG TPA: hypothetical protein VLD19_02445, partial [Chitinophagaceae bacterium]|nr:hypothetical protein [Chitinophagaceae bacterium]
MHRIPRLIRLAFSVAAFLFVLMFLLRLTTWMYFRPPGTGFDDAFSSFVLGFRYDAREVGIVCLLILLLGSIPVLHPYNTARGRIVAQT